jgi:transposase InsO family protein
MSNKNLSRRSFLKGAAVSALGMAAIPALSLAEEKAAYTPGVYSAVVKAYGGFITATLTFSETAITDCVIDAACETPTIGGVAAEEMAKAILAEQKADVVSSASAAITVPAVKKAVNNCIAQAMGLAAALNENAADEGEDWLGDAVEEEFAAEHGSRGYRVVNARLRMRAEPIVVSEKRVRAKMRERGLEVCYAKKRRRYSSYAGEPDGRPANLPLRPDGTHDFSASAPNELWVSDITEFKLPDDPRKVYLSPVVDMSDGKPVGWAISGSPDAALAESSLLMACSQLRPGDRPVCHTDGGCHYRWPGWKRICEEHGIVRSMSRKGRSPDNAAAEGFFGNLKNEFFHGRDWRGVTQERFIAMLDWWMRRYSTERLKAFREDGRTVYDTIDGRRRRLGLAV